MDYKQIFLNEEAVPVSPMDQQEPEMSDEDIWNNSNKEIVDDESLTNQFSVEGLPVDISEDYVNRIQGWRENIDQVADKIEEIYQFATENADKPGAGEIFSTIGGLVEKIMTDFGTLNGHLRSLGNKVKVSLNRNKDK